MRARHCAHPYCTEEETEAQRGRVSQESRSLPQLATCLQSCSPDMEGSALSDEWWRCRCGRRKRPAQRVGTSCGFGRGLGTGQGGWAGARDWISGEAPAFMIHVGLTLARGSCHSHSGCRGRDGSLSTGTHSGPTLAPLCSPPFPSLHPSRSSEPPLPFLRLLPLDFLSRNTLPHPVSPFPSSHMIPNTPPLSYSVPRSFIQHF